MNVKDLILTADQLTGNEPCPALPEGLSDYAIVWPEYDVVFRDGPDAVICHRGLDGDELLFMLMSRGQFYLRRPEDDFVRPMTPKSLSDFLENVEGEGIDAVPWCSQMTADPRDARGFCDLVQDSTFTNLARRSMIWSEYGCDARRLSDAAVTWCYQNGQKAVVRAAWGAATDTLGPEASAVTMGLSCGLIKPWTRDGEVAVTAGIRGDVLSAFRDLFADMDKTAALRDRLGLDVLRSYMSSWATLPNRPAWSYEISDLMDLIALSDEEHIEFKPKAFLDYAVGEKRHGLGGDNARAHWLADWRDILIMELTADGEITDKYPRDLYATRNEMINRISRQVVAYNADDAEAFARRVEELAPNEWVDGDYFIEVPISADDIVDEGQQQHNCVGGYVHTFASGGTDLYFMRRVENPDRSVVTVEVRNGEVRQAYAAHNQNMSDDQRRWLSSWCDRCGITKNERFFPMTVGDARRENNAYHGALVGNRQNNPQEPARAGHHR